MDTTSANNAGQSPKPTSRSWQSRLINWKTMLGLIVVVPVVGLIGLNVFTFLQAFISGLSEQPEVSPHPVVQKEGEYEIDDVATVPVPVGFTWRLEDEVNPENGTTATTYFGIAADDSAHLSFSVWKASIEDQATRQQIFQTYVIRLPKFMNQDGRGTFKMTQPPVNPLKSKRGTFGLTGTLGDGRSLHVRAGVDFGVHTYHFEAYAKDAQNADALFAMLSEFVELAKPEDAVATAVLKDDGQLEITNVAAEK